MSYCKDCPNLRGPSVEGVGNPCAKIAIVGRNPGRTEAQTGVPFTGPSGRLLDAILSEIGMNRDDLWITNAVNCHVYGDEVPSDEMYTACHGRLVDELKRVKPELVIAMGNEAISSIIGKTHGGVMSLIGSMHFVDEIGAWVLPTYHPAFVIRGNIDGFDDLYDGLKRAKELVAGKRPYPAPLPREHVHYFTDEDSVRLQLLKLNKTMTLAIDTETDSVRDPSYKILLVQLSDGVDAWVFEADCLLSGFNKALFTEMLKDPARTWIFHNAAFDLRQLKHHWGVMPEHIEDSMAYALCLDEKLNHAGLKRLVNTWLSVPHYEEEKNKYLTHKYSVFSDIPREVLVPYSGYDAIFTYRLLDVLKKEVEAVGLERLYPLLVEVQRLFAQMAYDGVSVDLEYAKGLREEYIPLLESLEKEMQAYAWGKGFRATEVVKNADDWPFLNVKSPKQMIYFLNHYEGFDTKTSDFRFMQKNEGHEFIDMLFRYRKVDHLITTYVDGIGAEVWPDGRVHPDFVHGTVTGRITIQHPALQTTPGDDFAVKFNVRPLRRLFVAEPGHKWVHIDYSQLEIRVAWHITGDEALGAAVMTKDMHRTMAGLVYRKDPEEVTPYERSMSKLVTFGMLYGRQAPSLARQMKITVEEAQSFLDKFAGQFPKYFGWWLEAQKACLEVGYIETQFGRRRHWGLITPEIEREVKNQAVNYPIQSTASDICLSSLIKISKILQERNWGRALFSVHDSVELHVKESVLDEAVPLFEDIMIHPFTETCAVFKVKTGIADDFNEASKE